MYRNKLNKNILKFIVPVQIFERTSSSLIKDVGAFVLLVHTLIAHKKLSRSCDIGTQISRFLNFLLFERRRYVNRTYST